MDHSDKIFTKITSSLEWLIILITFYISVSNTNDNLFIIGSSFALLLIYRIFNKIITLSWFDLGVILLWIYGFVGNITSINFINSFVDFKTLTISILSYFLIRSKFNDDKDVKKLLLSYSIIIGILIIISLISFFIFSEQIYSIGFDNLYSFRFKYRPLGNIPNVWATLLLGFGGIISLSMYYYRNNNTVFGILSSFLLINLFGIIISFSRGIYLSFFISGILYFILIMRSKMKSLKKASLSILMILPIIIFIIFYNEDVFQTINFNKTPSQQRSISGRIDAIKSTKDVILESPLIGVGTGNYSLAINTNRYEDDNNDYTSFAPNGFIQLVVEQGIIGFCLWTILLIILLIQFFRKNNYKIVNSIIIITLVSILIREATFPVLFYHSGMMLIGFTFLAILQNNFNKTEYQFKISKRLGSFLLVIPLLIAIISTVHYVNEKNNALFMTSYNNADFNSAENHINKTTESVPYLFNRSVLNYSLFKQNSDTLFLFKMKQQLNKAISINIRDYTLRHDLALVLFEEKKIDSTLLILDQLTSKFTNNALYNFSHSKVLYYDGKTEKSVMYLIKAIKLSPNILESDFWSNLRKTDSLYALNVSNKILENIYSIIQNKTETNPIIMAKYGKILLLLGEDKAAEVILNNVVCILPNLIMPWYHLGQIETKKGNIEKANRYFLYSIVLGSRNYIKIEDAKRYINSGEMHKDITKTNSLYSNYEKKFSDWYRSKPLIVNKN